MVETVARINGGLMAEYPEKKKYPERQFTAENAMQHYFSTLQEEENDKRAMNIMHNLYLLSPGYAGSSEASYNASQISKGSSTGTAGLATRYRIMGDADKERVSKEFTTLFQAEDFPDMETFYKWTKTMGPWYSETLLRQHESITKNRVDAMKSTKVGEVVDTLFDEYNDEWLTADYTEQNQVRTNIAESDAIQSLPSKWRSTAIDEIFNRLKGMLAPTGQYAAEQAKASRATALREEQRWAATQEKETAATSTEAISRSAAYRLFEYMKTPTEAPGIGEGLSFEEARNKVVREMEGTGWNIKAFEDIVKNLEPIVPPKRQTKTYYDPDIQDYVLATEEEAEAEGLLPEKVGAQLQPQLMSRHNAEDRFWLDAGDELQREGVLTKAIYNFYRKHARLVDDPREQDSEIIRIWKARKKKLEASSKPTFEMSLLYGGQATGQTDDGLSNPRLKKIDTQED